MNIYVYGKDFFKENATVQKAILSAVDALSRRISAYEAQNIEFSRIFNDPTVKYDKHGEFFTFKSQKSNMQIRLLYTYLTIEDQKIIVIADFHIKKRNSKDYIRQFDAVNRLDPMDAYSRSIPVR